MQKKLVYEFWETDPECLDKFYARQGNDLFMIRKELAKEVDSGLKDIPDSVWLDIGSGNGSTLSKILEYLETEQINLSCIEPSKNAVSQLEQMLARNRKINNFTIRNSYFSPDLIPEDSFNVITLLHSIYYLGVTAEDYQRLFNVLYQGLKAPGKIISLSISSKGDFNKLGDPNYSNLSCADNLFLFLKEIGYSPRLKELPTRFNVTDFINNQKKTKGEFKSLYQFVNQKVNIEWDAKIEENFRARVRDLSVEQEGQLMLDFKDSLVVLTKNR